MSNENEWTIPDADRTAIDALELPPLRLPDPADNEITYPYCGDFTPTGRQCRLNGGLDVGQIWMQRCVNENGSTTKNYDCRPV